MDRNILERITFDDQGLVPAIVQDVKTKEVLMLAYMNNEAIMTTLETKRGVYYSRSRQELWVKGSTSGNTQHVVGLSYDCDGDTILLQVEQTGVACHTGEKSCFFTNVIQAPKKQDVINELYALIRERKESMTDGSYTSYLFESGLDKILKKIGEEASEVIIAAKNEDKDELIYESSDLVYHLLVLLVNTGISIEEIKKELEKRRNSSVK
nr:bifunctional phosphoribosyl-AMP cyclohydrolase/phosphoribosyl-ATP diphosphatase HisIE [Lottiidibacillus patelloidae]